MSKSPEGKYEPTPEEIQKAEEIMTEEQRGATELREEHEPDRKSLIQYWNLPEDATWEDINKKFKESGEDEKRRDFALLLGLPENATVEEIAVKLSSMQKKNKS